MLLPMAGFRRSHGLLLITILGFLCLQCPNLRNTVGPKSHKLVQVSPATSSLTSYVLILLKGIRHYCSLFGAYAHSCIYNCY